MPPQFRRLVEGADQLAPGRALDVGCGSGEDAVFLARRGWQVTGVDIIPSALAKAQQRAAEEGVDVQWIAGDVSNLGGLGLNPGYSFLYDMGCIHGLPDVARTGVVAGLTALATPGATLLLAAFKAGRRMFLPRGMDEAEITRIFGDAWRLVEVEQLVDPSMPLPIRRAQPCLYRLIRRVAPDSHAP